MTKNDYAKLLSKDSLTATDAGRIILFDLVDQKRRDKTVKRRIDDAFRRDIVYRAVMGGGETARIFERYRQAFNHLVYLPGLADRNRFLALWGLESLTRTAREVMLADMESDTQAILPKIVTKSQYKELQKIDAKERRRKLKAHSIFRHILDYALTNHDRKTELPFIIERDKLNQNPPKGWTGRRLTGFPPDGFTWEGLPDKYFYPSDGTRYTPFEALSDPVYYHTSTHISRSIQEDFPEVTDAILDLMAQSGVYYSPFHEEEWPKTKISTLLDSKLGFLYRRYLVTPDCVAIIKDVPSHIAKTCIDEQGRYVPPVPMWYDNCFLVNPQDILREQADNLRRIEDGLCNAYSIMTFAELSEEAMNVPNLRKLFTPMGEEEQLLKVYNEVRESTVNLYRNRLLIGTMRRQDFEQAMKMLPVLNLDNVKPKPQVVELARTTLDDTLFMGKITAMLTLLKNTEGAIATYEEL